jgi:hypothetical protein
VKNVRDHACRYRSDIANALADLTDHEHRWLMDQALDGRGAFRRFRIELYERQPHLIEAWHAFHDNRAHRAHDD